MRGYNLATYRDRFLLMLEERHALRSSAAFTDNAIFDKINESLEDISRALRLLSKVDESTVLGSGLFSVRLPSDVLQREVLEVRVADTAGQFTIQPKRVAFSTIYGLMQQSPSAAGEPSQWAISPAGLLTLYPALSGRSANVSVRYLARPAALHRLFYNALATAEGTYGDSTVTISLPAGISPVGNLVAGDDFGLLQNQQIDGSSIAGLWETPRVWYRILEVNLSDGIALTLDRPIEQPSFTATPFVCSQVSDLEKALPGVLLDGPGKLAAAAYLHSRDSALYQDVLAEINASVGAVNNSEAGLLSASWNASKFTPFLG